VVKIQFHKKLVIESEITRLPLFARAFLEAKELKEAAICPPVLDCWE
jgi:hypothetical protein